MKIGLVIFAILLASCGGDYEEPQQEEDQEGRIWETLDDDEFWLCMDQDGEWYFEGCSDFPFCLNLSHDAVSYCECYCLTREPDDQEACNLSCTADIESYL